MQFLLIIFLFLMPLFIVHLPCRALNDKHKQYVCGGWASDVLPGKEGCYILFLSLFNIIFYVFWRTAGYNCCFVKARPSAPTSSAPSLFSHSPPNIGTLPTVSRGHYVDTRERTHHLYCLLL